MQKKDIKSGKTKEASKPIVQTLWDKGGRPKPTWR